MVALTQVMKSVNQKIAQQKFPKLEHKERGCGETEHSQNLTISNSLIYVHMIQIKNGEEKNKEKYL